MGLDQDRGQLETHLRELAHRLALEHHDLSPDARVTGYAAMVHSEALLFAAEVLRSETASLVHDGLRPLMEHLPDR